MVGGCTRELVVVLWTLNEWTFKARGELAPSAGRYGQVTVVSTVDSVPSLSITVVTSRDGTQGGGSKHCSSCTHGMVGLCVDGVGEGTAEGVTLGITEG